MGTTQSRHEKALPARRTQVVYAAVALGTLLAVGVAGDQRRGLQTPWEARLTCPGSRVRRGREAAKG